MSRHTPPAVSDDWDTHCHVFDPVKHPYIEDTPYAPPPRLVDQLVAESSARNHVIVMSVPEGTSVDHTLEAITALEKMGRKGRGTVVLDVDSTHQSRLKELHAAGIRSVRIHLVRVKMRFGEGFDALQQCFESTAKAVAPLGWCVDAQLALPTWAKLAPTLRRLHQQYGVTFVSDHIFCAESKDHDTEDFRTVLQLVEDGCVYVKLSGLDRCKGSGAVEDLREVVRAFIKARGGECVLYGSDWPHIVMGPGSRLNEVDLVSHRSFLWDCTDHDEKAWTRLMRENAERLYT